MPDATNILNDFLTDAQISKSPDFGVNRDQRERLSLIVDSACNGKNRAVLAVTATLLFKKTIQPEQDIR